MNASALFRITVLFSGTREGMIHKVPIRDGLSLDKAAPLYASLTGRREDARETLEMLDAPNRPSGGAAAVTAPAVVAHEPRPEIRVERTK